MPSPASGILTKILVEPDETVPVGTVLGEITPSGANGGAPAPAAAENGDSAGDESAAEVAEFGPDAEEGAQAAKDELESAPAEPEPAAPRTAPRRAPRPPPRTSSTCRCPRWASRSPRAPSSTGS